MCKLLFKAGEGMTVLQELKRAPEEEKSQFMHDLYRTVFVMSAKSEDERFDRLEQVLSDYNLMIVLKDESET